MDGLDLAEIQALALYAAGGVLLAVLVLFLLLRGRFVGCVKLDGHVFL